tara:strand:+ start:129 stop:404 length:276 start_codon:yes stop_codon:yes gene_type:complete
MSFDVASGDFSLEYTVATGDWSLMHAAATDVYVWPQRYPGGVDVAAAASDGSPVNVSYDGLHCVQIFTAHTVHSSTRVVVSIRDHARVRAN